VAITGGLLLAVVEMILEKIFTKKVHNIAKFNFCLIAVLGGLSLLGEDGLWFKLQPFFTGLFFGGFILIKLRMGKGLMQEMMEEMSSQPMPAPLIRHLERNMAVLLLVYGVFMAGLAVYASTGTWAFFKTIGFYLCFGVFMLAEMFYLRAKKHHFMPPPKF
jgi:intracellular septation protein